MRLVTKAPEQKFFAFFFSKKKAFLF